MCGRYALHATKEDLIRRFGACGEFVMRPRYNISPGEVAPVLTANGIVFARWGLVPDWFAPTEQLPAGYINARVEGIEQKPSFKSALKRPCIIPASGYYEWAQLKGAKQPYYIRDRYDHMLALLGIMGEWKDSLGNKHSTFAILTQVAEPELQRIHNRQPLILRKDCTENWLKPKKQTIKESFVKTLALQTEFAVCPVSKRVGNPKHDAPECIMSL